MSTEWERMTNAQALREISDMQINSEPPTMLYGGPKEKTLRLSREERDYIADHALDSVCGEAQELARLTYLNLEGNYKDDEAHKCSSVTRKIAALSNLLGDIGWQRETPYGDDLAPGTQVVSLGELFPVAQLRPWLEEWQRQDDEALAETERTLEVFELEAEASKRDSHFENGLRQRIADAQTKLGAGAILLARIEKWMASHGN